MLIQRSRINTCCQLLALLQRARHLTKWPRGLYFLPVAAYARLALYTQNLVGSAPLASWLVNCSCLLGWLFVNVKTKCPHWRLPAGSRLWKPFGLHCLGRLGRMLPSDVAHLNDCIQLPGPCQPGRTCSVCSCKNHTHQSLIAGLVCRPIWQTFVTLFPITKSF